ncbi:Autophagy-related protein [Wickerhamomyces ciferrii]|uniref:Autophagy-related protein n=1 Tax=Wickerhamomyces ciferrii (strain ATCC 14091 / BCRC 22168 / CBS 111 / JCM 3599 / NBRC 0793 / NRRL Y-1031 F-60-10) TaxID=1206466 RepID=K0KUP8_WICCF|nr:Autophagy-related protein [Wickerhamomyces ciferrii]CCH44898.1 Autophagy-related protein [Wickerhamomyces ciferrii]
MVDLDSIKRASELVNSILHAKGFLETNDEELLFKSINDENLQDLESIQQNDKLVINTIYSLIQSYEKSKTEIQFLMDQLNDKKEIINHYEESNKELHIKNESLIKLNYKQQNEINHLQNNLKLNKQHTLLQEKNFLKEKHLNNSLKTKYEIDIKRKTVTINQLQDKLLKKHKKFQNVIEGNITTTSSIDSSFISNTTNDSQDNELEKMMINLSQLITNITLQNDENLKFINYLSSYLSIIIEFLIKKLNPMNQDLILSLPPSPKFFYSNFLKTHKQESIPNQDISTKISNIIDYEKIQSIIFPKLDKFYELIINQDQSQVQIPKPNGNQSKILELEMNIKQLNDNLKIAIETNEKWSKKFNDLERNSKSKE